MIKLTDGLYEMISACYSELVCTQMFRALNVKIQIIQIDAETRLLPCVPQKSFDQT